jgi:integrase
MSNSHPTLPAASGKPAKPYPEFPLTAHPTGRWCKKILGKLHYFGPWADPQGALDKYLSEKDTLHAGRVPRPDPDALTVKALANAFLHEKMARVDVGELSRRTWGEYKHACDLLVSHFGKLRLVADLGPDDFAGLRKKIAGKWGPVRVGNVVQRVRSVFKFAADMGLIDRPVRFGPFKGPSKKTLRLHRAKQGLKLFTREEVHRLLGAAPAHLRAMILLGINCGFGNADVGTLPLSALDLDHGWVRYPRPKTGIDRRCPLWPQAVQALKEALAVRPEPKDTADAGLVFITKYGKPWHKDTATVANPLSAEMGKLLHALGINGRQGLGFYTLRHTFRTVADESRDQVACDHIMGHADPSMAGHYRERISDERLRAVTDHVRAWLYGSTEAAPAPAVSEAAFDAAFSTLDAAAGSHNFLSLRALREALTVPREAFDALLHQLRRSGRYSLSACERAVSPEDAAAGIQEHGQLLVFVSRK